MKTDRLKVTTYYHIYSNLIPTKKRIIATIPFMGKYEAVKEYSNIFINVDKYKDTFNGKKNWVDKYVDRVIDLANSDTEQKYILIDTDSEILNKLDEKGIMYSIVLPSKLLKYIGRYIFVEGTSALRVYLQMKKVVKKLKTETNATFVYLTDGYIADLFVRYHEYTIDAEIFNN